MVRAAFVAWGVCTAVFVMLRLSGDPIALLVEPTTPPAEVEALRQQLGLDRPIPEQYLIFLGDLLRGDFGHSLRFGQPALEIVLERLGATLELAAVSTFIAVAVGLPAGILGALKPKSVVSRVLMSVSLLGLTTPTFMVGIFLILIFAAHLRLLPTGGRGDLSQLIMPSVTLAFLMLAMISRVTRSAMLDVLSKDYMRTARGKGLSEREATLRHALRNAAAPIVTVVALQLGHVLGGSLVTETVFAWPGMGRLAIQAIDTRDYAIVQAVVILSALWFVALNTLADVMYALFDPRLRQRT